MGGKKKSSPQEQVPPSPSHPEHVRPRLASSPGWQELLPRTCWLHLTWAHAAASAGPPDPSPTMQEQAQTHSPFPAGMTWPGSERSAQRARLSSLPAGFYGPVAQQAAQCPHGAWASTAPARRQAVIRC